MVAISSDRPSHHNRLPPITASDQQQRLEISVEAADQRAETADHGRHAENGAGIGDGEEEGLRDDAGMLPQLRFLARAEWSAPAW